MISRASELLLRSTGVVMISHPTPRFRNDEGVFDIDFKFSFTESDPKIGLMRLIVLGILRSSCTGVMLVVKADIGLRQRRC
jgi:hypothetical protein